MPDLLDDPSAQEALLETGGVESLVRRFEKQREMLCKDAGIAGGQSRDGEVSCPGPTTLGTIVQGCLRRAPPKMSMPPVGESRIGSACGFSSFGEPVGYWIRASKPSVMGRAERPRPINTWPSWSNTRERFWNAGRRRKTLKTWPLRITPALRTTQGVPNATHRRPPGMSKKSCPLIQGGDMSLHRGQIVYVTVSDPQGRNPKRRPAIVLTPTDEIAEDGSVQLVAISNPTEHAPSEHQVLLPWHPQGQCGTRLRQESAAVCTWVFNAPRRCVSAREVARASSLLRC